MYAIFARKTKKGKTRINQEKLCFRKSGKRASKNFENRARKRIIKKDL